MLLRASQTTASNVKSEHDNKTTTWRVGGQNEFCETGDQVWGERLTMRHSLLKSAGTRNAYAEVCVHVVNICDWLEIREPWSHGKLYVGLEDVWGWMHANARCVRSTCLWVKASECVREWKEGHERKQEKTARETCSQGETMKDTMSVRESEGMHAKQCAYVKEERNHPSREYRKMRL